MNNITLKNKIEIQNEQELKTYLKMKRMLEQPVVTGIAS